MANRDHPNLVLATCILASSLAFVDGSVTNVGLPAIGQSLQAGGADLQWVINAFLLPLSALLLLGGAAGDRYGRNRLLIAGTVVWVKAANGHPQEVPKGVADLTYLPAPGVP